jgi:hypothetical protein
MITAALGRGAFWRSQPVVLGDSRRAGLSPLGPFLHPGCASPFLRFPVTHRLIPSLDSTARPSRRFEGFRAVQRGRSPRGSWRGVRGSRTPPWTICVSCSLETADAVEAQLGCTKGLLFDRRADPSNRMDTAAT